MTKSTTLHRSDTFPYDADEFSAVNHYAYNSPEGWYTVVIDEGTDDFILTTPEGKQVEDSREFHKRKDLYKFFEDGIIYEWLLEVYNKITQDRSAHGISRTTFVIDDLKYVMRVNAETEMVWLTIPAQTRIFKVQNLYLENPDFPLILDGILDDEVRKRLQRRGFELPRVPYKVGLGITPKITNTHDEDAD